jgi:antirestriction protein
MESPPKRRNSGRYLRGFLPFLAVGVGLAGAAVFSLQHQSAERLERGEALEAEGKVVDAIEQYEWSIQAYTPFSRSVGKALSRLEYIANAAEKAGREAVARKAWQAVVSGLSVIEHFRQPYRERLEHAKQRLDEIEQRMMKASQKPVSPATP